MSNTWIWKNLRGRLFAACLTVLGWSASVALAQPTSLAPVGSSSEFKPVQAAPASLPRASGQPATLLPAVNAKPAPAGSGLTGVVQTQEGRVLEGRPEAAPAPAPIVSAPPVSAVEPVATDSSCSSCGRRSLFHGFTGAGCSSCGSGGSGVGGCGGCGVGGCHPGQFNDCSHCSAGHTCVGRMINCLYHCICCPDPCYEPRWIPEQNAAFFVDPVRPVTQTRIRYDAGFDLTNPDRAEFFWAKRGKGPGLVETGVRYDALSIYTEIAPTPKFSMFFEVPYLALDPQVNAHAAGFADINVGTKSVLFDCELLVVAFQFRTYIPTGNFTKGLGTSHVSLEPALIAALKLGPETYFQSMLAEWIPIGGDQDFQGSILHYHFSLNHVLCRCTPDVPLIGTMEFNGYSFQDGLFTDPAGIVHRAGGDSYLSAGPGLRMSICNRIDFGFASAFALGHHGPNQLYRTEFRFRF